MLVPAEALWSDSALSGWKMRPRGGLLSFSSSIPHPCYGDAAIMVHAGPLNPIGGGHLSSVVAHVLCGSLDITKVQRFFPSAQKRLWFEGRTQVPGCKGQWPCRAWPAQFIAATYCWVRGGSGAWLQKSRGANIWGALLEVHINVGY